MSLYVRLETSFWKSRKTLRLRSIIGDSAFWVPARLWCYAAENQPNGIFSDYTPSEIACAIEYTGDADKLIDGLVNAGFMDSPPLAIHNWQEYNGYHLSFHNRAKSAAKARWDKTREEKTGQDKTRGKHCSSIAPSNACSIEFPECLQNESFKVVWNDWLQFRKEIKKPVTPTSAKQQLAQLSKAPSDAPEIIRQSIRNGWQGLFDLKSNANHQTAKQNPRNVGIYDDPDEQGRAIAEVIKRRQRERDEASARKLAQQRVAAKVAGPGSDAPRNSDDGERGAGFLLPILPKID